MGIRPLGKINNNGEIHSNQRVLFDPYIYKVLSHVKSPRTFLIHERYHC